MFGASLWPAVLGALVAIAHAKPTRTTRSVQLSRRAPASDAFVSTENGQFVVNGEKLKFTGTNIYWLPTLANDDDIDKTLADVAAAGIRVIRTWGFDDVVEIPEAGTWFQQIKDGKYTINEGPNGLQRLDKVLELAQKHGIYVNLCLTNNWNPNGGQITGSNGQPLPRHSLSTDFGGMDLYVRDLGLSEHDQFYKHPTIVDAFKKYTTHLATRYKDHPAVFGWELANDPRCNSTLPAGTCDPQIITNWHAEIAQNIRDVDTNHLISSGNAGYLCVDCPKLFPQLPTTPPPAAASPVPGTPRRRAPQFLTKATLLRKRAEAWKRSRTLKKRTPSGPSIRARWARTPTRRQADLQAVGPAFDGSFGVDSQDITNIPDMDFGTFQYFPDQTNYGPDDPNLTPYENKVATGNAWVQQHAETAADLQKPVTFNAFGLVTQNNAASFVPFNAAAAPFAADSATQTPFGVTDDERDSAYRAWTDTARTSDFVNSLQWQWGQEGLTVAPGSPVTSSSGLTGVVTGDGTTGVSPNDGYSINGVGRSDAVQVIQQANQPSGG